MELSAGWEGICWIPLCHFGEKMRGGLKYHLMASMIWKNLMLSRMFFFDWGVTWGKI